MSRRSIFAAVVVLSAAIGVCLLPVLAERPNVPQQGQAQAKVEPKTAGRPVAAPCLKCRSARRTQAEHLGTALGALDAARKAVESGDKAVALAELARARQLVSLTRDGLKGRAAFVNVKCPMMGSPIDPAKVTPMLVRQYKGGSVAFCCPGCPAMWDRLSDAQKQTKLEAVLSAKPAEATGGVPTKPRCGPCCCCS